MVTPLSVGKSGSPKTIRLDKIVKCPECGREAVLYLRARGKRWYAYAYHGYLNGKRIEHYIGPCPEPFTKEFEEWLREVEAKRCIRIWLPLDAYERLLEIAHRRKKYVEEYVEELVLKHISELSKTEREARLATTLEAMSHPTPQPQPSQPEKPARRGKAGLLSWM